MKRILLSLLFASLGTFGCNAQQGGTVYEPVRFEDGTAVAGDAEAEALFAKDLFRVDTTLLEKGDTLFTFRHAGAFVRLQLDGLPAGIDKIRLVPMEGAITEFPVTASEMGAFTVWLAKEPGGVTAAAAVAQAPDGRVWSARLPALALEPGIAYRWIGTLLPPEAPFSDLKATPLPATLLDIDAGEYSGITHISGNRYAVVDDKLKGGGIIFFSIPIDAYGSLGTVRIQVADGTKQATGKAHDCEGIAFDRSSGTLYVSSEDQEIRGFDLAGQETGKAFRIPKDLGKKDIEAYRGFESLTFNEAAGLFWTTTEAPLKKDTFLPNIFRLQSFDRDGKPAERYLYQAEEPAKSSANTAAYVFGIPALAALDDGRLLVLEREVYVPQGGLWDKLQNSFTAMSLYLVDPVHDTAGILRKSLLCSFRTGALDLANFEGMCLGPVLPDGARPLLLIADSQRGYNGLTNEYMKVILLR